MIIKGNFRITDLRVEVDLVFGLIQPRSAVWAGRLSPYPHHEAVQMEAVPAACPQKGQL